MLKKYRRRYFNSRVGHDQGGMMRWMLTYADLITLLMVFFVVMYAMSATDKKKFSSLKSSLQIALRTDGTGKSTIMPNDEPAKSGQHEQLENAITEMAEYEEIISKIENNAGVKGKVAFMIDERGLTIRFPDSVLFELGENALRLDSFKLLDIVGEAIKNKKSYIRVEGHTDNLPINTPQFPSNWELSAARSVAVTKYLTEKHVMDPRRLSSLGYGEYHPLHPNTTDENRAKNRRVDIVILRSSKSGSEIEIN